MSNQELLQVMERSDYKFKTDKLMFTAVGLKGKKKHYVTGYISTTDIDLYNDLVTNAAMKSMIRQIYESNITIDYEHEAFRDDPSILPVGKIVEAKMDEKGLWVKAVLNSNSPKFKDLWGSIKDGFINAFSIAFQPLKTVVKNLGDDKVRLIEDLKLLNVALTGVPVNQGAVVTDYGMKAIMLKAISESEKIGEQVVVPKRLLNKLMEEKNMVEEEQKTETTESPETPAEETPAVEGEKVEAKDEAETAEPVAEEPAKAEEPVKEEVAEPVESKALVDLKSEVEKLKKENAQLKNDFKALEEKAVFKSPTPEPVKAEKVEEKSTSMLNRIQ